MVELPNKPLWRDNNHKGKTIIYVYVCICMYIYAQSRQFSVPLWESEWPRCCGHFPGHVSTLSEPVSTVQWVELLGRQLCGDLALWNGFPPAYCKPDVTWASVRSGGRVCDEEHEVSRNVTAVHRRRLPRLARRLMIYRTGVCPEVSGIFGMSASPKVGWPLRWTSCSPLSVRLLLLRLFTFFSPLNWQHRSVQIVIIS